MVHALSLTPGSRLSDESILVFLSRTASSTSSTGQLCAGHRLSEGDRLSNWHSSQLCHSFLGSCKREELQAGSGVTVTRQSCATGLAHTSTVSILCPPKKTKLGGIYPPLCPPHTLLTMIIVDLFSPKPLDQEAHCPPGEIRTTNIFLNESIHQFTVEK